MKKTAATKAGGTVAIAYCHPAEGVSPGFHHSLLRLMLFEQSVGRSVVDVMPRQSGANVSMPRNELATAFLSHKAKPDWLWFVDADMTFTADTLQRLLAVADREKRPIVGGLCFGIAPRKDESGSPIVDELGVVDYEVYPTLYLVENADSGLVVHNLLDYPEDHVIHVHATGTACLLIHRSVLERFPEQPFRWFRESTIGDQPVSEDITFCLQAGSLGFPTHVHTGIKLGHQKQWVVTDRARR
jgi:hypothetical protein